MINYNEGNGGDIRKWEGKKRSKSQTPKGGKEQFGKSDLRETGEATGLSLKAEHEQGRYNYGKGSSGPFSKMKAQVLYEG